jgi:hypothetical protein
VVGSPRGPGVGPAVAAQHFRDGRGRGRATRAPSAWPPARCAHHARAAAERRTAAARHVHANTPNTPLHVSSNYWCRRPTPHGPCARPVWPEHVRVRQDLTSPSRRITALRTQQQTCASHHRTLPSFRLQYPMHHTFHEQWRSLRRCPHPRILPVTVTSCCSKAISSGGGEPWRLPQRHPAQALQCGTLKRRHGFHTRRIREI